MIKYITISKYINSLAAIAIHNDTTQPIPAYADGIITTFTKLLESIASSSLDDLMVSVQ